MGLREYLLRRTIGLTKSIEVHKLDEAFITELPKVHKLRKSVEVHKVMPELKVDVLKINLKEHLECRTEKITFNRKPPAVHSIHIRRYTRQDIKIRKLPKRRKINIWKGTKKAQSLPIELQNKLKQQKNRPSVSRNEMILAWYWPIVDGAVLKLALNKQRGTLLVWYDPRSRKYKARGVYLVRRMGAGAKPEWRWV